MIFINRIIDEDCKEESTIEYLVKELKIMEKEKNSREYKEK
jgi:hypothetical protein